MARRAGDNLALQSSATEGGSYTAIGCFTQLSANLARDRFEVTCGGDTNKTYVLGKKDFTITGTMVFDDTNDEVWEAADSDTPLWYRLYPDLLNASGFYWQGQFYLDASIDIPVAGAITSAVNLAAAGSINHVTGDASSSASRSVSPSAAVSPAA
jgi:hypothetical protein